MNDFPDKIVTEEELVASGAHHHPFPGGADGAEGAQLHDQAGKTSLVLLSSVLLYWSNKVEKYSLASSTLFSSLLHLERGRRKFANIISRSVLLAEQVLDSKGSVGNSLQAIWTEHKLQLPLPTSTSPSSPSPTSLSSCLGGRRGDTQVLFV